jgi:hypothetical protein
MLIMVKEANEAIGFALKTKYLRYKTKYLRYKQEDELSGDDTSICFGKGYKPIRTVCP